MIAIKDLVIYFIKLVSWSLPSLLEHELNNYELLVCNCTVRNAPTPFRIHY
jgi:hypothetical protein